MARTRGPQKLSFVQNPVAGTVLAVSAGGQVEAEFDFSNDSPEVAAFELAVDGLSSEWLNGAGPGSGKMAAASGGGALRLAITPPRTASVGEYDFSVRIVSFGEAIAPATTLVLRVEPAAEEEFLPEESAPAEKPLAPKPAPRRRTTVAEPTVAPVALEPPLVFAAEPKPVFVSPPAPVPPAPEPIKPAPASVRLEPLPIAPEPIVREPIALEPIVLEAAAPEIIAPEPVRPRAEEPPTPAARPPQPVPRPRPAPLTPVEEAPVLVDYQAPPSRDLPTDEEEETPEEEAAVVDLPDGSAIALKPGETKLLRFTFTNEASREATYVLDEDQSLPEAWITLVQDQVNLTRNGKGDVSLRLSPPLNAEPGDYPFSVTLGQQGGILTPRSLTLTVQATPAVKLTSKEKALKIGPMASFADFTLTVESAGNADTAFRLAVTPPRTETENASQATLPVYGTQQWQYLFDKELETLRAPVSGRTPRPVTIRLRLQRKGFWWFGFRETHQVRVAAVPVTDTTNGGKPGNTVEVTAIRQRFWPMPYLTLIPLFLVLLMLGSGGASDLSVSDGQYQYHDGMTDVYWVATPGAQKNIGLEWSAPATALLRLTGSVGTSQLFSRPKMGSGKDAEQIKMDSAERSQTYNYQISRLIGGGDKIVSVRVVQTSSVTPLETDDAAGRPLSGTEVTLNVPSGKIAKLVLKNGAHTDNALNYWMVKPLGDQSSFKFLYSKNEGSIEWHSKNEFPIVAAGKVGDTDQIVFVTTDAAKPVLTVNLKQVAH